MMQKAISVFLVSLLLLTSFTYNFGLVLSAKEKRGWTLNSAGYLLGPHAVDNHRSFIEKHGLAGKRELQTEENTKLGNFLKTWMDDKVLHTIIEFLTYLHLKETGALDNLSTLVSSEETSQS
uniref:Galanin peptides n=1 Tax=Geotrypetes seraphini TaxID=260995 RepID=A0A6P8QCL7_GEOSA|nr:galanin peptides-like [Geotrypetes seraphini]XP_033784516.1 galanin peptides-like [Geotrypetes seraphini]XP_033784517.1 galanin peptides-like [Geotrypetes seraphini]